MLTHGRLVATRAYSDFTFKVAGCDDHKVHKLILAAKSPVFRNFFMVHEKVTVRSTATDAIRHQHST